MRRNVLLTALLLALLIFVPPAFATSISYSGSAVLDFSRLTLTGIAFTKSNFEEFDSAFVASASGSSGVFSNPQAWVNGTLSASVPSVGSATASGSNTQISGSASLDSFGAQ
jgi:hypothetical protein